MLRKICHLLFFVAIFFAVERFCRVQTEGFSVHKILSSRIRQIKIEPEEDLVYVARLLKQPFHFLAKGGQCYAFVSEDNEVVIKFFKQHHMRSWDWVKKAPLPFFLEQFRLQLLEKYHHRSAPFAFKSCEIADTKFKKRTGLLYLHLHHTDYFQSKLCLIDKLGIAHQIDLNRSDFVLQKKAEPFFPRLEKLIEEKNWEKGEKCIDSFIELVRERCQQGIRDEDLNIRKNFGFIGDEAIEIDLGSYTEDPSLSEGQAFKGEVLEQTRHLKKWLDLHSPELARYLAEKRELL